MKIKTFSFGNGKVIWDNVKSCFSIRTIAHLRVGSRKKRDIQGNNVIVEQMKRLRIGNSCDKFFDKNQSNTRQLLEGDMR